MYTGVEVGVSCSDIDAPFGACILVCAACACALWCIVVPTWWTRVAAAFRLHSIVYYSRFTMHTA